MQNRKPFTRFLFLILFSLHAPPSTLHALAGWDEVAVRVENRIGATGYIGSGTIAAGDGQRAIVVTCRHIFAEGSGRLTVTRADHRQYPARVLGLSRRADLAVLSIAEPDARRLRIASQQAPVATLIGFGNTDRSWKERGRLVELTSDTAFYSFKPLEGDSGGGVFDDSGCLVGVAWGTDGAAGAVVPLADLREALDSPTLARFFQPTEVNVSPYAASILAASMMGQLPPLPPKSAPQVQASPQAQSYAAPGIQADLDVPVRVRLRVIPEVEALVQPRQQTYAAPPTSYGGGCYGGSYSGGFSYGGGYAPERPSFGGFAYEAPGVGGYAYEGCPGGICPPRRGLFGGGGRRAQFDGRTIGGTMSNAHKNKIVYRPFTVFGRN